MSRAGKKKPAALKKRSATNLTIDESLREWGVAYVEKHREEYRGSLSELINRLLEAKRAEADTAGKSNSTLAKEISERNLVALKKQHAVADLAKK